MSRNIVPRVDKGADLGTDEKNWNKLYADAVVLRGSDLQALLDGRVSLSTLAAKGDMYVATGPGTATRLPAGTDGYVLKANSGDPKGVIWGPAGARQELTGNLSVSVGVGGDFPTINAALASVVSLYYPKYISSSNRPRVTINLMPDFVMEEQVLVDALDLSWITITGYDDETPINIDALTILLGTNHPAFGVTNGGCLPIIGQLFNMNATSAIVGKQGILVGNGSKAIVSPGCGIKNAGQHGIYTTGGSTAIVSSAVFSGAWQHGVFVTNGSIVHANSVNASGCQSRGIVAHYGSIVSATNADTSGSVASWGIWVYQGSIVFAYGSLGSLSQDPNTVTENGIIFKNA